MSDIPKSKRRATTLDAQSLAYNLRSEITTELMLTFGYSEKKLKTASGEGGCLFP